MPTHRRIWIALAAVLAAPTIPSAVSAAFLSVIGGPAYDATSQTGYQNPSLRHDPGSTAGNGAAISYAEKYANGVDLGSRAVRWDVSGTATELGNLGTDNSAVTYVVAFGINPAGAAVGYAYKNGEVNLGERAVRWDASSGAATELDSLGSSSSGSSSSDAYAINAGGVAVGTSGKYVGGTGVGSRAVRWDASGTAATELGNLGANISGITHSQAYSLNTGGTAVGYAEKWTGNTSLGYRARPLGCPGHDRHRARHHRHGWHGRHSTRPTPSALPARPSATRTNTPVAHFAANWPFAGTPRALPRRNLGTSAPRAAAPRSPKPTPSIPPTLPSAMRRNTPAARVSGWRVLAGCRDAAATELGNLGTTGVGSTDCIAYAINSVGYAVGYAENHIAGFPGDHAVVWNPAGVAIDLNTLIDPNSGWSLLAAVDISDTNLVTGIGSFDPDGAPVDWRHTGGHFCWTSAASYRSR